MNCTWKLQTILRNLVRDLNRYSGLFTKVSLPELPTLSATVKSIVHNGRFISSTFDIPSGTSFGILLDRTNFFAESGGQIYDTGMIYIDQHFEFEVENVQSYGGYTLHVGSVRHGTLNIGDTVVGSYNVV